jgi:two-component system sensor histidine kinase HydH
MPTLLNKKLKESRLVPRTFLWTLLGIFNAFLWLLLLAFHWEISLRSREVNYFGTQLFPLEGPKGVPLPVIYGVCVLLTVSSAGAILLDRSNLATRERIRTLLFQILDSLEIGVVVLDEKDLLTMANDSARHLLPEIPPGYASLDILELMRHRPRLQEIVKAATQQGEYVKELEHDLHTSGDPLPVRITTLPLKDPQKRTIGTLLLVHDQREALLMERQMRTAERLSALGTLAAAMAHEIRNPLEAMNLNLALLERSLPPPSPAAPKAGEKISRCMKVLESEIARLAAIVENFLSFARPSDCPMKSISLEHLLRQIVDLLSNQAQARKVTIHLSIEGTPEVLGAEDQLKQAFLNLAINSLEAMPRGGSLTICAEACRRPGSEGEIGDRAVVSIQDTGVGIPVEQLGRLFDPYYTTRPRGTGLGLTIVRRVIHDHRGEIRVASVPGQGSTFTVELPQSVRASQREFPVHV